VFRKITLALATTTALGAAALGAIPASAGSSFTVAPGTLRGGPPGSVGGGGSDIRVHDYHGHPPRPPTWGILGDTILETTCSRNVVIETPRGPRVHRVNVCD
jgi:hypothetical protein